MTNARENTLITLLVTHCLIGFSVAAVSLKSESLCIVKFDSGDIKRCSSFEKIQDCNCSDEDELIASQENILEVAGGHKDAIATGSSLRFSRQLRNHQIVLRLADKGAGSKSSPKCWYLQAFSETREKDDAQVVLSGLVSDFNASKLAVFNASECSPGIENLQVRREPCFENITHSFEIFPKQREMAFKLFPAEPNVHTQVIVDLWSSLCKFRCNFTKGCDVKNTTHAMEMTETWQIPISTGFHCLRVSRYPRDGCVIHTETKELKDINSTEPVVESGWDHLLVPIGIATMSGVFVVVIMGAVCILRGRRRSRPNFTRPDSVVYETLLKTTPQVFLLYSRDSPEFCAAVKAFRTILERHITKVIDPFDETQHDEILRNRESWLASLLADTNVKIVFILSEGAIFRQRALMDKKFVVSQNPHCLDSIFITALNHIQHNMTLINDYRRIFSVRFEDTVAGDMSPGLTPLIRFTMLRDLAQLLGEIRGNYQIWVKDADETSPDFESFKSKIEDMKRMKAENIHFMHSFVEKAI